MAPLVIRLGKIIRGLASPSFCSFLSDLPTNQGGDQVDAVRVVRVVHLDAAHDLLVATSLDRGLERVSVVEVLHCLRAEVDAQLLQLAGLRVLEPEHVEDPDEAVRGVPDRVGQDGLRLARLLRP